MFSAWVILTGVWTMKQKTLSQWPRKLDVKEMLNSDFYVQLPAIYPVQYCSVAGLMDTSCWELRE